MLHEANKKIIEKIGTAKENGPIGKSLVRDKASCRLAQRSTQKMMCRPMGLLSGAEMPLWGRSMNNTIHPVG